MLLKGCSMYRVAASVVRSTTSVAIAGCLLASLPLVARAQSNPGFTIFSGVEPKNQLNYHLDFGGNSGSWDRYRLRIKKDKMKVAVAQFAIDYPTYFKGQFDPNDVELRVNDKKVALQEVKWEKENNVIEVFPQEPVPAATNVELILSNVKNPNTGGMFYFNCNVLSPGDVPLLRTLGTWIIGIQ
ncbi:DUF2808 domain-containing protein [Myxacorys almedinensis A]|uniref:DUF2808 domain-containing protein n=2 Tax=Myxacorys TaxID=2056239 RepID=A0A8J7Z261_9CYAN|nr:DUF2808 domain-containing protein [Myxacorys almedinensis A]